MDPINGGCRLVLAPGIGGAALVQIGLTAI